MRQFTDKKWLSVCIGAFAVAGMMLGILMIPDDTADYAAKDKMVELKTDLPLAKHDRTQKPKQKSGEKFMVPKGTKLLSRGVEVTSSDNFPIGKIEQITDGNEEDGDEGIYWVGLVDGLQWVQLDLGKPHKLYAILVWHYYSEWSYDYSLGAQDWFNWPRVYHDVVVQVSDDPAFKKDVRVVFNNDHDNSSGLGQGIDKDYIETSEGCWIDPKGLKGRYVRLYSNGYTSQWRIGEEPYYEKNIPLNDYIEVEVYGK